MANKHGDFIWYELLTSDADAAQAFYGDVTGWTFQPFGGEQDYRIILAGTGGVGGVMPITADMAAQGAKPGWIGYIAVGDVDASADQIKASGGTLFVPPTDIPGVGRFALAADPSGAPFYIMRGLSESDSIVFSHEEPQIGLCGWNELCTPDQAGAWNFYSRNFGWVNDDEMDMGPMGKYQFIRHGFRVGAVMPFAAEMGPPHWNFYFRVADIDAAKAKTEERGAKIIFGPVEVPGGDWVFQGIDPQGAHFCIVGAKS